MILTIIEGGIKIIRIDNKYQLCTRPEHYPWISKLTQQKGSKTLSTAALETLSIIAYKQPITKKMKLKGLGV